MSQLTENNRKIDEIFGGLIAHKDRALEDTFKLVGKKAMNYALELHDAFSPKLYIHPESDNHYGVVVRHEGTVVTQGIYHVDTDMIGEVDSKIAAIANDLPEDSWEMTLIAEMGFGEREDYEETILEEVKNNSRNSFPNVLRSQFERNSRTR